jgi:hypothetical protein
MHDPTFAGVLPRLSHFLDVVEAAPRMVTRLDHPKPRPNLGISHLTIRPGHAVQP